MRLTSIVSTATQKGSKKQKRQKWNKAPQAPESTEAAPEPPKKKIKPSPSSSADTTKRPTSQKRSADQTWADVVRNQPNPPKNGKGKGQKKPLESSNKSPNPQGHPNSTPPKTHVVLLESAWGKGALVSFSGAKEKLEAGHMPGGNACLCQTLGQVQDLQRLAKLHNIPDKAFALVWAPGKETVADSKLGYLPTVEQGKVTLRQFSILPLMKALPKVPLQTARATDFSADRLSPRPCSPETFGKQSCGTPEAMRIKCSGSKSSIQRTDGKKSSLPTKSNRNQKSSCRDFCAHKKNPSTRS